MDEVEQFAQDEIIYLVSDALKISKLGLSYFFTDGHALQYPSTRFFIDLEDISHVNMKEAFAIDFSNSAEFINPGLKRRKQSEFHVHKEVGINLIDEIVVMNENSSNTVKRILEKNDFKVSVRTEISYYF